MIFFFLLFDQHHENAEYQHPQARIKVDGLFEGSPQEIPYQQDDGNQDKEQSYHETQLIQFFLAYDPFKRK